MRQGRDPLIFSCQAHIKPISHIYEVQPDGHQDTNRQTIHPYHNVTIELSHYACCVVKTLTEEKITATDLIFLHKKNKILPLPSAEVNRVLLSTKL